MMTGVGAAEGVCETDVASVAVAGREVTKSYGAVPALVEVDSDLRYGEILALAGENGCRKIELSRRSSPGRFCPDRGRVTVDGLERSFRSPRDALDAGIALVAQEPAAAPTSRSARTSC